MREFGQNMTVCPKCEIASGSDKNAKTRFVNFFNKIVENRIDELRIAQKEQEKEDRKYGTYEEQHRTYR